MIPPLPTPQELSNLIKPTWFEIEENNPQRIELCTRDHGDVGDEEPGEEDIEEAKRLRQIFKRKYPDFTIELEAIDEWVHVSVIRPQ